jgi:hypothetical protein
MARTTWLDGTPTSANAAQRLVEAINNLLSLADEVGE